MSEAKAEEKQAMDAPPVRGAEFYRALLRLPDEYARSLFPQWDALHGCPSCFGMCHAVASCPTCKGWGRVGTNGKALRMPRNK